MAYRRNQLIVALLAAFFTIFLLTIPCPLLYNHLPKTYVLRSECPGLSRCRHHEHATVPEEQHRSHGWQPFFERKDILGRPDKPRILFWTTIFGSWFSGLKNNGTPELPYWTENRKCADQCYISNDRRTINVSDAIVFYYCDLKPSDMPAERALGQKWVFWSLESPTNCKLSPLVSWKAAINWTMTYRLDSDVLDTYGNVTPKKVPTSYSFQSLRERWKRKTVMAVWPVSHCNTFGKREHFVDELRKYMRVDVYGKCGNFSCPRFKGCHKKFATQYFFLLSFENTVCKDYVTEKLYYTLTFDMIPVTFGGADYKAIAPPESYIDAFAFKTPKDLADYLKRVSEDFDLYKKYFAWKATYDVKRWVYYTFCNLCSKLYSSSFREISVYPDIVRWWNDTSQCRGWNRTTMQLS